MKHSSMLSFSRTIRRNYSAECLVHFRVSDVSGILDFSIQASNIGDSMLTYFCYLLRQLDGIHPNA